MRGGGGRRCGARVGRADCFSCIVPPSHPPGSLAPTQPGRVSLHVQLSTTCPVPCRILLAGPALTPPRPGARGAIAVRSQFAVSSQLYCRRSELAFPLNCRLFHTMGCAALSFITSSYNGIFKPFSSFSACPIVCYPDTLRGARLAARRTHCILGWCVGRCRVTVYYRVTSPAASSADCRSPPPP